MDIKSEERRQILERVQTYSHFSHQHPLVRSHVMPAEDMNCSGCGLSILSGNMHYYHCKTCPFFLHQVCYSMPRKTRHTAHPAHHLNLFVMPLSARGIFKCNACGNQVSGFYYTCTDCGICYHILCKGLLFSVAVTSHPHLLKLEFYPPYDIYCDLCKEGCFNGWLYRCRICDFDTHLACAIGDLRLQLQQTQATQNSDYVTEGNEVIQLIAQSAKGKNFCNAVAGWDERLHSPKQKLARNGQMEYSGTHRKLKTGWFSPNLMRRQVDESPESDQSSLPSVEQSTAPSYQFSDGCFSIDLATSYSSFDHKNQGSKEARNLDISIIPDGKQSSGHTSNIMLDKITNNLEEARPKSNTSATRDFAFRNMDPDSRLSKTFLTNGSSNIGGEVNGDRKKISNESTEKSDTKDKNSISTIASLRCSSLGKIFNCCS